MREPLNCDVEISESAQKLQAVALQTLAMTMNVNFAGMAGESMAHRVAFVNTGAALLTSIILSDMDIIDAWMQKSTEERERMVIAVRKAAISVVKEELNY